MGNSLRTEVRLAQPGQAHHVGDHPVLGFRHVQPELVDLPELDQLA
ncbi:hypothetical protein [Streptomyces sp. NBC_00986]|nr:hypothetical protein OG504_00800 [Streptomyces sp. NBC_00986]